MADAADIQRYYAEVAQRASCCPGRDEAYSPEELAALPEGAYLGLGTGNPVREAALAPGEVVLDLGSGAGVDVLLAARRVGPAGRAIGVDFTPEMVERARRNAAGAANVELHLAPMERLPLPDASVDVVVSNCVINLSLDKPAVLREAHRVLKPGGRFVVSDTLRLPGTARSEAPSCDCEAGAMSAGEWKRGLLAAGFVEPSVRVSAPGCCGPGAAIVRARKA